jgi:primosomal protein N' (replication factor Y)
MAAVEGGPVAVAEVVDGVLADLPAAEVLGPVELEPERSGGREGDTDVRERALVRVPRAEGKALAAALHAAQAGRTARKAADPVRVRLDPVEIG